jgi:hypothetical protein
VATPSSPALGAPGAAMARPAAGMEDLVERIPLEGDSGEPLAHELESFVPR